MIEYVLNTEKFHLSLCFDIYEDEFAYTVNTIMTVSVTSDGFSASADLDIDIKEFVKFAKELKKVYDSLNGSATIKEPYGYGEYISFIADNRTGHITVKGFICDDLRNNELRFENSFDQTYLKSFSSDLIRLTRNINT